MAVVLKPVRGNNTNHKTNRKTGASDSDQLEKKSAAVTRTLSTSTSSLGSEVVEERPPGSLSEAVQGAPDVHETAENVETSHVNEDAHEESVEDQTDRTGKVSVKEKHRSPVRVRLRAG